MAAPLQPLPAGRGPASEGQQISELTVASGHTCVMTHIVTLAALSNETLTFDVLTAGSVSVETYVRYKKNFSHHEKS
ncbi:hypothetical protein J6590_008868 [Homalodisca vitripennis]|nr:hypothetical protein J6590_008868 [Homalodisca vitripennis]